MDQDSVFAVRYFPTFSPRCDSSDHLSPLSFFSPVFHFRHQKGWGEATTEANAAGLGSLLSIRPKLSNVKVGGLDFWTEFGVYVLSCTRARIST